MLLTFQVLWKRRQLEQSCRWTRARLEAHQQQSASKLRSWALARSPFYRRFHRGLDGKPLSDLPILTKAILMENFDELVTDPSIRLAEIESFLQSMSAGQLFRGRYVVLSTSGSTGRRGIFLFNTREWVHALALITRPLVWSGLHSNLFHRRRAIIASKVPWHYSTRVSDSLTSPLFPSLRIDAAEPLDRIVHKLNEWRPEMLAAYPSVLRPLLEEQIAGRLSISPRYVGTSAEVLTAETRARVRDVWGARISDTYGGTEYAPIAAECEYGRKHLVEDSAIIELVDDGGQPVPPGHACERVLLTVFHRYTQPLIRYEISDIVRPAAANCECGRPFLLIDRIEGRVQEVLYFPAQKESAAETAIHPNIFHELLERLPVSGWQVIHDDGALRIRLLMKPEDAFTPASRQALEESIRARLEAEGALPPFIQVEAIGELSRGATSKAPLIQSRVTRKGGVYSKR
jgi:putative adenylate-forming enzyme